MEQIVLSREEYDGGQRLVRRLMEQGFGVLAVFWTKRPDDTSWTLHVVSPQVGAVEAVANCRDLSAAIDSLADEWAHPFERIDSRRVRLLGTSDRLAETVVDTLTKYSLRLPCWHRIGIPWPNQYDDALICPLP